MCPCKLVVAAPVLRIQSLCGLVMPDIHSISIIQLRLMIVVTHPASQHRTHYANTRILVCAVGTADAEFGYRGQFGGGDGFGGGFDRGVFADDHNGLAEVVVWA